MTDPNARTDSEATRIVQERLTAADERWLASRARWLSEPVTPGPPSATEPQPDGYGGTVPGEPGPHPSEPERLTRREPVRDG